MLRKKLIRRFDSRHELSTATRPTLPAKAESHVAERSRGKERMAPRLEARLVASVEIGQSSFVGFTENISREGVFVATQAPQSVGATVLLLIALPDLALVHAEGTVCWTRSGSKSKGISPGIGVRFEDLSALDAVLIEDFVRARRSSLLECDEGMRRRSA
jgi:uncharacterized protein (TIGR02266 family)